MAVTAFCHIAPYRLLETDQLFKCVYYVTITTVGFCNNTRRCVASGCFLALTMKAERASETSVYFNESTHIYIPEGYHFHLYFGILWWIV
jgi:hypothetical protein